MEKSQESETVIQIIKNARKALNFSQRELGLELGVSQTKVSMWENGVHAPKAVILVRIANLLGKKLVIK